jgi:hypothetical protein
MLKKVLFDWIDRSKLVGIVEVASAVDEEAEDAGI